MTKLEFTVTILLVILTINYGSSRSIKEESGLVSDDMDHPKNKSSVLELRLPTMTTTVTCEPTYGFLPCTTKLWGQLFLLVVYEYLLRLSEQFISSGSNLFFQMFGTGIFGASLFQILGMFPQVILVLVSGVSASEETIQTMATISMGMLAGSTIMMLTIIWGSVIAFGSYDLSITSSNSSNPESTDTSVSPNAKNNKPFSLTGYGVRTDIETKYSAIIMLLSMVPFLILQLASILSSATATRVVVLISLITTVALLVSYCTYQVFEPWIQDRRLEYLMLKYIRKNLLHRLLSPNGRADELEIKKLFHRIDKNHNSRISSTEVRAFILGIQIEEVGLDEEDFETKVMEEFDISGDSNIDETEFVRVVSNWLNKANNNVNDRAQGVTKLFHFRAKEKSEEKQSLLSAKKGSKDQKKGTDQPWWNYTKAAFLITLGTAITVLLTNPLMTALVEFSTSANIPSFLVSYVVVPLALNFRLGLRAITSARQKSEKAASLTFSELYGAVFMNNIMGLTIFLGLVYIRDISWGVSAEVLVVLLICTAIGVLATLSTKIQFWTSIPVYLLYPISLLLLYVLTNVLGWS